MNIWNNDKDYIGGTHYYGSWSANIIDLKNPSEWGDIVFVDDNMFFYKASVVVGVFLVGLIIIIIYGKDNLHKLVFNNSVAHAEREQIQWAKHYIEEHYADERLVREDIANGPTKKKPEGENEKLSSSPPCRYEYR